MNTQRKNHHSDGPRRKLILGTTVVVLGGLYIWHRRVLDHTITLSQAAVADTMWRSFDEGVRYGLRLTKEIGIEAAENIKSGSEYAFGVFDKAS